MIISEYASKGLSQEIATKPELLELQATQHCNGGGLGVSSLSSTRRLQGSPERRRCSGRCCQGLANITAVPAGRLEETIAYAPTTPANAYMEHIILAAMEYLIEATDQQKA